MNSAAPILELADGAEVVRRAWRDGLRPDPRISNVEWAEKHRILPGKTAAEGGPFRVSRTPYVREILERLNPDDPTHEVWLIAGGQVGKTTIAENWFGRLMDTAGGPCLAVRPTLDSAAGWNRQRIQPMIESTPTLLEKVAVARSRDGGNTLLFKDFIGGYLRMIGANSASGLKSSSEKNIYLDELDEMPPDIGGQGPAIDLARVRTRTFKQTYKIFGTSTPTIRGASPIETVFMETNQKYFHVPCPGCGELQVIRWENIRWDQGDPSSVHLVCVTCDEQIAEHRKTWMLEQGDWIATAVAKEPLVEGYHLSGLYSPIGWYSWEDAVKDHLKAKRQGREARKTWVNTVLAETFEEGGDGADSEMLIRRTEKYPAEVPAKCLVLTAGVDVHKDRFELEVVGYGIGEESWGIDYRVIQCNPLEIEAWQALDDVLLMQKYRHEHGDLMPISAACVDSGYSTQQVYAYTARRSARNIFAIKGMAGSGHPIVEAGKQRKTGRNAETAKLFTLGVDAIKGLIYSRLRLLEEGPGYCHFPQSDAYGVEYFQMLCAEKRLPRYSKGRLTYEWRVVRPGGRNEALDCRVYSYAALQLLNPVWSALRKRRREIQEQLAAAKDDQVERPPKKPRRERLAARENFVNKYRKGRR